MASLFHFLLGSSGSHNFIHFLFFFFSLLFLRCCDPVAGQANYRDALAKSILFFQGQRSGKLPPAGQGQDITWRSSSGLQDGKLAGGADLTGGYYDAGDNVKFNFPMSFTTTILSWGAIEYAGYLGPQLPATRAAIRWSTDYLLKCALATPGKLYVGVGDPNADHSCWERPEDMDTPRSVYSVSASNPGSDVAAETAAALAAASIVFRKIDANYTRLLLRTARSVMQFAIQYRGAYSDSLGAYVCPFYCSYSGYQDELLWGASWLYRATNDNYYLNFLNSLGANDGTDIFSWDNKYAGARVLLARRSLVDKDAEFQGFQQQSEDFMCRILPNSPYSSTQYTPGGLIYKLSGSNLQYVTSISFLLATYSKYMATSEHTFNCGGNLLVTSNTLRTLAKKQINYILGDNPMKMSYMVGYGSNYPRKIHHRGSSIPSIRVNPKPFGCQGGFQFYYTSSANPNVLTGAIVGGPNDNDIFSDDRTDYAHSEPATYINAAAVGPLALFAGRG